MLGFLDKLNDEIYYALFHSVQILVFASVFAPMPHIVSITCMDPKLP